MAMKATDAAILQRDVQKSIKVIGELIRDGVGSKKIDTMYSDKINAQIEKIQNALDKMEY